MPRNSTIPELHWHLGAHDKKKWREDQKRALGLPATESHFQKKIRESHKIKKEDGYSIKKDGCNYIVTAPQPEEDEQMQYTLSPSPFSVCVGEDACECLCQICDNGICAHQGCNSIAQLNIQLTSQLSFYRVSLNTSKTQLKSQLKISIEQLNWSPVRMQL